MLKQRIYIDTSVIGGCFDEEFSKWSNLLVDEIINGSYIAVISELTRRELEGAPDDVQAILHSLPEEYIENVFLGEEAIDLAQKYVDNEVVTSKHIVDAQHIAIAAVEHVDVVISWNFRHIVNLERIRGFNSINLKLGYPILEIRCPREIVDEKEL